MSCDANFTEFSMKMEAHFWVCHEGISASIWLSRKILPECGWQYPWVLDSVSGDRAHLPRFPHCTHSTMAHSCYDFVTLIDTAQTVSQKKPSLPQLAFVKYFVTEKATGKQSTQLLSWRKRDILRNVKWVKTTKAPCSAPTEASKVTTPHKHFTAGDYECYLCCILN